MPVTARLSSRFYEKLGDEATNELVDWLNDVDAEFRLQLREINDRNWDRFRGELDGAKAAVRAEIDSAKAELRTEIRTGLADLRSEMATGRAELHKELANHLRWTFAFWVTTLFAVAGLRLL